MLQTLLKSIEAEDIYKKLYPGIPNPLLVVYFIINNNIFPRSINYNINKASELVNRLFGVNNLSLLREQPFVFDINKLASEVNYLTMQDLENKSMEFLEKNIQKIENITLTLERDYL
ncbi:MAG: alpha-E domain-containing protein [Chitinophagales bacterium]